MNRRASAEKALANSKVLNTLDSYRPTVVSTIWVELDTDDSDIDIICQYEDSLQFAEDCNKACGHFAKYQIKIGHERVLCRFELDSFTFEIFANTTNIADQPAYRHFEVMQRFKTIDCRTFNSAVRQRKLEGLKTEPAIAELLELKGDPYEAVAALLDLSIIELENLVRNKCLNQFV